MVDEPTRPRMPKHDVITANELILEMPGTDGMTDQSQVVCDLVNMLGQACGPMRQSNMMQLDNMLMTALIVFAGCIYAEDQHVFAVPDMTDDAMVKFLRTNFTTGIGVGQRRMARAPHMAEEDCPGHVASEGDPKVCSRCGVHIDSLRDDDQEETP